MTRAEEILNKAIDYSEIEENFLEYDDCGDVCNDKEFIEQAFTEGAKWAEKTMIEKACKWLYNNTYKHSDDSKVSMSFEHTIDMINNFCKAMEE